MVFVQFAWQGENILVYTMEIEYRTSESYYEHENSAKMINNIQQCINLSSAFFISLLFTSLKIRAVFVYIVFIDCNFWWLKLIFQRSDIVLVLLFFFFRCSWTFYFVSFRFNFISKIKQIAKHSLLACSFWVTDSKLNIFENTFYFVFKWKSQYICFECFETKLLFMAEFCITNWEWFLLFDIYIHDVALFKEVFNRVTNIFGNNLNCKLSF